MLNGTKTPAGSNGFTRTCSVPTHENLIRLAAARQYERIVELLKNFAGRDPALRNFKGVCLLRLGRFEEAVRDFRDLALKPGCVWMRPDLPTAYKTNFATALLLGGHPAGCLDVLAEINDESNASVRRLRAAIGDWELQLPFWSWLNWRVGRIGPANQPVAINFEPGEFDVQVTPTKPSNPPRNSPNHRTAA